MTEQTDHYLLVSNCQIAVAFDALALKTAKPDGDQPDARPRSNETE